MESSKFNSFLSFLVKHIPIFLIPLIFVACQDQVSITGSEESPVDAELQEAPGADRYIVVFDRDQVPSDEVSSVLSELSNRYKFQPTFVYRHALSGFAGVLRPRDAEALKGDGRVLRVSPDVEISLYPEPQHHDPDHGGGPPDGKGGDDEEEGTIQVTPWGIERVGGPLVQSANLAWVIDTGIDLSHEDLNVNTTLGKNCVTRGKDSFDDGNGHGTHVAGTIAAIDNTIDVVGVTENTELVPVRVLDNSGSGFLSWIICGVDHVAANFTTGDVANMSLGGKTENTDLDAAVLTAAEGGLLFSIASGNSGEDASLFTPARTGTHANVYTVAAIDQNDTFTSWSNFGNPVTHVAPGVGILSTKKNGGTEQKSGTSMAAPHVAGLLLLDQLCDDGTVVGTDNGVYKIAYRCI